MAYSHELSVGFPLGYSALWRWMHGHMCGLFDLYGFEPSPSLNPPFAIRHKLPFNTLSATRMACIVHGATLRVSAEDQQLAFGGPSTEGIWGELVLLQDEGGRRFSGFRFSSPRKLFPRC